MLLQLCTWCEVEEYLKRSSSIVVPIGSTEQHGPTGLIGTDAICPEVVARGLSERHDILVAPTLSIGMAQHHLAFPGSITLRPTTLIAVIKDITDSLARHGFDKVYFLNGHGGNVATVTAAFSEIYAESSLQKLPSNKAPIRCKLKNWYDTAGARDLSKKLYGDAEGAHATPSEVSLSYFAHPDSVKTAKLEPKRAPWGPIRDADDYRRHFPDGRIGSDPSLSTIEHGERIYEATLADIARDFQSFAAG